MTKDKVDMDTFLVDVLRDRCGIDLKFEHYSPRPETAADKKYKDIADSIDVCDCTTRALSKALDRDYDDVQAEQLKIAKRMRSMPNVCVVTEQIMEKAGWVGDILLAGETIPVAAMIAANPSDRYIIGAEGHMIAIVDGVVYDDYETEDDEDSDPELEIKHYLDVMLTRMCSEFYIPDTDESKKTKRGKRNVKK